VVGGALAKPKGLISFFPAISVLISTSSIGVKNPGNYGCSGVLIPLNYCKYLCIYQEAVLPSLTASTRFAVPQISPPPKIKSDTVDFMVYGSKLNFPVFLLRYS